MNTTTCCPTTLVGDVKVVTIKVPSVKVADLRVSIKSSLELGLNPPCGDIKSSLESSLNPVVNLTNTQVTDLMVSIKSSLKLITFSKFKQNQTGSKAGPSHSL